MKGKWLTYIFVMMMIVGCVDYSMQKDSGVSAFSSGIYGKCPSPTLEQSALIAEDFPNISVSLSYALDLRKDNDTFVDLNRDRLNSIVLFYLADKKLGDFKGSACLQKIADDLKIEFSEKLNLTSASNEITKVWITRLAVSREKNKTDSTK